MDGEANRVEAVGEAEDVVIIERVLLLLQLFIDSCHTAGMYEHKATKAQRLEQPLWITVG